jgi:hypothetical protein
VFARHGLIIVYAILACVMESTLRRLTEHLRATGQTLATAESCTGGWLAKCLTDLPGSSHWFQAGWVCYSNEAKHRDLGVRRRTLREAGAVSADTVYELAEAALRRSGASFAVAISGSVLRSAWVVASTSKPSASASVAIVARSASGPSSTRCAVYTVPPDAAPCIPRERLTKYLLFPCFQAFPSARRVG